MRTLRRSSRTPLILLGLMLTTATRTRAQAVRPVPDASSYATAAVNPGWVAVEAWRASGRACRFWQLGVSEAIGNSVALLMKAHLTSPRPCAGCDPDGMPSGHTLNATIGFSRHWPAGLAFSLGTGALRVAANRHTWAQVSAGAALGAGAELAGRALIHCR